MVSSCSFLDRSLIKVFRKVLVNDQIYTVASNKISCKVKPPSVFFGLSHSDIRCGKHSTSIALRRYDRHDTVARWTWKLSIGKNLSWFFCVEWLTDLHFLTWAVKNNGCLVCKNDYALSSTVGSIPAFLCGSLQTQLVYISELVSKKGVIQET